MLNPINLIVTVIQSLFTTYNGRKITGIQGNSAYSTGYQLSYINMIAPYGMFALPNKNTNAVIVPINGSPKSMQCIGYIQSLPNNTPINMTTGEFCYTSDNWALVWNNDGLRANKLDNAGYLATLPSGDWMNYLLLNRINEISNVITEMNVNINNLITWAAAVTTVTGVPPLVQSNLTVPATLSQDTTYINNQNDLLNNNAAIVP